MDQLKAQLANIKQHSFWVMCVGILLVSLGSWWYSTGSLRSEKTTQEGKIKTSFSNVKGIQSAQPKHPNAITNKGMDDLVKQYAWAVAKGWEKQYARQADVLVWPATFTPEFLAKVETLRPIEQIPP